MSPSRIAAGRRRAARVLIALAAASACIGAAVAFAATRSSGVQPGLAEQRTVPQSPAAGPDAPHGKDSPPAMERPLRPRLIETPPGSTAASDVQFRFRVQPRKLPAPSTPPVEPGQPSPADTSIRHFQCRVDGEAWSDCQSPYRLTKLAPGSHRFAVRVFNREERAGEPATYDWRQTTLPALAPPQIAAPPAREEGVEPQRFTVAALRDPEDLYPGLAPTPIPVRVTNPNDVAIEVTAITVGIAAAPASCGSENFELSPAGLSPQSPLVVPANGSADLPSAGLEAPAIRMLDLPVEQDACRAVEIPLVFGGEARG
ncbi:MAG: hypothetical protein AB7V58_09620 [Solirubrobacterales bacterium]